MPPPTHRGAFTLLEVVAAMAVASVIFLALAASLRIAFRARESAELATQRARTVRAVAEQIRRDLELALPGGGVLAGSFVGTDDYLDGKEADGLLFRTMAGTEDISHRVTAATGQSFSYAAPAEAVGGGVQEVEYRLVRQTQSSDQLALVRQVRRNLLSEVQMDTAAQVLAHEVRQLSFRYYDGEQWLDSWDVSLQDGRLPIAVEVVCELGGAHRGQLVDIIRLPLAQTAEGAGG